MSGTWGEKKFSQEMDKGPEQKILKRNVNSQKYEKCWISLTSHEGNANQNQNETDTTSRGHSGCYLEVL